MTSAHFSLDSLLLLVDRDGRQMEGATEDIMSLEPLREKFLAFGWAVEECDGHDFASMREARARLGSRRESRDASVAKTVLGKGVSFLENDPSGGRWCLDGILWTRPSGNSRKEGTDLCRPLKEAPGTPTGRH